MKKKRPLLVLAFLLLVAASVTFFVTFFRSHRPRIWGSFGITLPSGYTVHGIDVSRWQQKIYWPYVQQMNDKGAYLRFAFIKATEGTSLTDKNYEYNWRQCRKYGLARGAYHFFTPGTSGAEQAIYFIQHVAIDSGDMPPVLDVEKIGTADPVSLRASLCDWLLLVEQHYGIRPIIYTNARFYQEYLDGWFEDYPLWVANYQALRPAVNRNWHFWQHSDHGRVDGIDSYVDFNTFSGDSIAFAQLLYRGDTAR